LGSDAGIGIRIGISIQCTITALDVPYSGHESSMSIYALGSDAGISIGIGISIKCTNPKPMPVLMPMPPKKISRCCKVHNAVYNLFGKGLV
jgi:hypothetical protein